MPQLIKLMNDQNKALVAFVKGERAERSKCAESFKPPSLPAAEKFPQWQEALRKTVVAGIGSKPYELTVWWNEIDAKFTDVADLHVSERADKVVELLEDSGDFLEWDVRIAAGGFKTIIGHRLEREIAEESRKCSVGGKVFKRQTVVCAYLRVLPLRPEGSCSVVL